MQVLLILKLVHEVWVQHGQQESLDIRLLGMQASSTVFSQFLPFVALTRFWGVCFRSQRLRLARLMGEFSDGFLTVVAASAMLHGLDSTWLQQWFSGCNRPARREDALRRAGGATFPNHTLLGSPQRSCSDRSLLSSSPLQISTKGCNIVRGTLLSRGKAQRADYILYYKLNMPLVGGRKDCWSFHITRNWRLTSRVHGKEIVDINFEDYH